MAKPLNEIVELKLPLERVGDESAPEEIRAAPAATRMENPFTEATKALERADLAKAADDAGAGTAKAVEAKLNEMNERVLSEGLNATGNPKLLLDPSSLGSQAPTSEQLKASAVLGSTSGTPAGFSNLDSLLTQAGPIQKGTAPILMPTDLLFDYNAFDLRSDAVDSLRKLGALIQRNPQASFLIEGHSDSFGPDDYNTWLSQQRAEAVKAWLVRAMGIDAARIGTRGLGKTRLLVSPDRSVQEQQLNRRVEIVIRTR
jgi:outer membrane protein OmpA-like peptidoglycan-associated protein